MHRATRASAGLLLLTAGFAAGLGASASPPPALPSTRASAGVSTLGSGVISGRVTDALSGAPLTATLRLLDTDGDGVGWANTLADGSYVLGPAAEGSYMVLVDSLEHRAEVYDDNPCPGEDLDECSLAGATQVVVRANEVTDDIDFRLMPFARVSGHIYEAANGAPINRGTVLMYLPEGILAPDGFTGWSEADGSFEFRWPHPGSFVILARGITGTHSFQLYDHISCPGGLQSECNIATGDLIHIADGDLITGIDFHLERVGAVSGRVSDELSAIPLADLYVKAFRRDRSSAGTGRTDASGHYIIDALWPGDYFIGVSSFSGDGSHVEEVYNDIPCWGGPPAGCDPTKSQPVTVSPASTTRFIDFDLLPRTAGIAGAVREGVSTDGLEGVRLDAWNAASGAWIGSTASNHTGAYFIGLPPGDYLVSTENELDHVDQIFNGIECPLGSAFSGRCELAGGTPVTVEAERQITGIDFPLGSAILFSDSFETGDFSRW